jgi:hypothetical protein
LADKQSALLSGISLFKGRFTKEVSLKTGTVLGDVRVLPNFYVQYKGLAPIYTLNKDASRQSDIRRRSDGNFILRSLLGHEST